MSAFRHRFRFGPFGPSGMNGYAGSGGSMTIFIPERKLVRFREKILTRIS